MWDDRSSLSKQNTICQESELQMVFGGVCQNKPPYVRNQNFKWCSEEFVKTKPYVKNQYTTRWCSHGTPKDMITWSTLNTHKKVRLTDTYKYKYIHKYINTSQTSDRQISKNGRILGAAWLYLGARGEWSGRQLEAREPEGREGELHPGRRRGFANPRPPGSPWLWRWRVETLKAPETPHSLPSSAECSYTPGRPPEEKNKNKNKNHGQDAKSLWPYLLAMLWWTRV